MSKMPPPEKPAESKAKRKAVMEDTLLFNAVKSYFKYAGVLLSVWGFGYFNFSPSWLLLGLVVFIWKEKNKKAQKLQIAISQEAAKDERAAILARVEDLPSWVFFPDIERAEWLNKMIDQLWPYIGDYVKDLLHKSIEPAVKKSLPATLAASFRFSQIDLGDIPPRIGGVKVYTENVRRDEIYMDLEIIYSSDSEITVQAKGINAGIKELQIQGTMRVIFKPLISKMPLFGGLSVFFLNNPTVDFNLTSMANAFDLPGLNDMLKNIVQEQIANIMVLPNRIPVSMAKGLDLNKLRYPQPQGVLRINIIEAKELKKADIGITGKGKSDPYVICSVGAQKFQTKVIDNTVEPVWNEYYEAIVDVADGQLLTLDVNDKDPGNDDDHLGGLSVDISHVYQEGSVDEWLPLEDVKKGLVHINLTWLHLANDPLELDRESARRKKFKKYQMEEEHKNDEKVSSCILLVNLDSAHDLPRGKKSLNEPSPHCFLSVGTHTQESWIKYNTNEPRWEQNFRFLIHNPNLQNFDVEVKDKKTGKSMGECSVKLKELLGAHDMILDQKFPLRKTTTNAYLNMRISLRVLTTQANPEWLKEDEMIIDEDEPVQSNQEGTSVDDSANGPSPSATTPTSVDEKIQPASAKTEESTVRQRKNVVSPEKDKGSHGMGRIELTLRYNEQRNRLVVIVHKCLNLLPLDSNNLSDPYVRLFLLPEKTEKRKTKVVKDNLCPVYDETFEFQVSPSDLTLKMIEVSIKNKNSFLSTAKEMMGVALIDLGNMNLSTAVTSWFDLQPEDKVEKVSLETEV